MQEKAPDKLVGIQGHNLAGVVTAVLVGKRNAVAIERKDAMIGDSHAVGVTAEVIKHLFRTGERLLGEDNPWLGAQSSDKVRMAFRGTQGGRPSGKDQLA